MFRIVFHLTVIGILLAVDLNHLHRRVVVVADQLRGGDSSSYVDLDVDKPGRACCRCPLSDAMELMEETMPASQRPQNSNANADAADVQTALSQRIAEPDIDMPSIYRMGFFWKARMCCDCLDNHQKRPAPDERHEWNRL